MEFGLRGRKIAVLAGSGIHRDEMEESWKALEDAGAELHLLSANDGQLTVAGGASDARAYKVHCTVDQANPDTYVALLLPGGDVSAMIGNEKATAFVRAMMEGDKPVAAVGTGAAMLIAANAVRGRTLSADPSLREQIDGAGGSWVEKSIQIDQKLFTSASGSAIPALGKRLATEFANKLDSTKVDQLSQQSFPASDPPPGPGSIGAASSSTRLRDPA